MCRTYSDDTSMIHIQIVVVADGNFWRRKFGDLAELRRYSFLWINNLERDCITSLLWSLKYVIDRLQKLLYIYSLIFMYIISFI